MYFSKMREQDLLNGAWRTIRGGRPQEAGMNQVMLYLLIKDEARVSLTDASVLADLCLLIAHTAKGDPWWYASTVCRAQQRGRVSDGRGLFGGIRRRHSEHTQEWAQRPARLDQSGNLLSLCMSTVSQSTWD